MLKRTCNFVFVIFLISCFALSGQASEICVDDCTDEGSAEVHAQLEKVSPAGAPTECDCSAHMHNCCSHFSMINLKRMQVTFKLDLSSSLGVDYKSNVVPAPFLDGPFQPPKA